ncbi:MAG: exodeoxyribonuclease VII large subunit [Gammaproteobacteria bacterium]|jgi:exodeoxyribonuclease VII large subunit|nr:exodeoxyribonuclease VII large subunit [Gammaproteobacteria bacterium]
MPDAARPETGRDVWTVSRLNAEARATLEGSFPLLWIEGEVSGFSQPRSGHWYFTLKDAYAQVRCAMFRGRNALLRFTPADGQLVLLRARVSFYEARGEFQLVAEHVEPAGEGALRRAFEELKARLDKEGLFDPGRKKPLPAFPHRVGVVTSPTGAALHDVLTVLRRRFPGLPVVVYPVPVQGDGAAAEIAAMLRLADARGECDVLLLTRGGGSPEDLACFNDEALARTVAALRTPIVSAVGHEVDFTIADFVADRRAPTPSAAAELISPDGPALAEAVRRLASRLRQAEGRSLALARTRLGHLAHRLGQAHPAALLRQRIQRLDELETRLRRGTTRRLDAARQRVERASERLGLLTPNRQLVLLRQRLGTLGRRLGAAARERLAAHRQRLAAAAGTLQALSPLATLERGYALVRRAEDGRVVRDCATAPAGTRVEALVADGVLDCRVESCRPRDP